MTLVNGVVISYVAPLINTMVIFASPTQGATRRLPLPLPFLLSLLARFFHIVDVKNNCCGLLFPFINDLKTCTSIQCANNKCKGQDEKVTHDSR
jgi:hypothetical protein